MQLRRLMCHAHAVWHDRDFIFTKTDGVYRAVTFGQLTENAAYLARALLARGLRDKRIVVYGENSVEWMTADLAVMAFVGINVGIDKAWKRADVRNTLRLLDVDAVLFSAENQPVIDPLRDEFRGVQFFCMQTDFPALLAEGKRLTAQAAGLFDFPARSADTCIRVVFSSGTVSFPKAVMLSDRNIFAGRESLRRRAPMDETDSCYLFLPLHHTYAGIYNFLYALISGMRIYLSTGVANLAAELREVNPTVFCGVPLIYRRMYEAVGGDPERLAAAFGTRPKYLFCGGAYLDEAIRAAYRSAGLNLLIAYALSETGSSFAIEYSGSRNTKSVGTVFEELDVRIAAPDETGAGEIRVRGDCVFLGYMNNPAATEAAFDADGYFCTGDIGRMDEARNLYLVGRKKRMILMENGENIYPENIEAHIRAQSANISSVKVFLAEKVLQACIYLHQPDDTDYEALVAAVNAVAPAHERVSVVEVLVDSVDKRMKQ